MIGFLIDIGRLGVFIKWLEAFKNRYKGGFQPNRHLLDQYELYRFLLPQSGFMK